MENHVEIQILAQAGVDPRIHVVGKFQGMLIGPGEHTLDAGDLFGTSPPLEEPDFIKTGHLNSRACFFLLTHPPHLHL